MTTTPVSANATDLPAPFMLTVSTYPIPVGLHGSVQYLQETAAFEPCEEPADGELFALRLWDGPTVLGKAEWTGKDSRGRFVPRGSAAETMLVSTAETPDGSTAGCLKVQRNSIGREAHVLGRLCDQTKSWPQSPIADQIAQCATTFSRLSPAGQEHILTIAKLYLEGRDDEAEALGRRGYTPGPAAPDLRS